MTPTPLESLANRGRKSDRETPLHLHVRRTQHRQRKHVARKRSLGTLSPRTTTLGGRPEDGKINFVPPRRGQHRTSKRTPVSSFTSTTRLFTLHDNSTRYTMPCRRKNRTTLRIAVRGLTHAYTRFTRESLVRRVAAVRANRPHRADTVRRVALGV